MEQSNLPLHLQFNRDRNIATIFYRDREVGVCHPEIAVKIMAMLQDGERLREDNWMLAQALQMVCADSFEQRDGDPAELLELMERHLENARRYLDKSRFSTVALLLRDRQRELDMGDKEFVFFCNSYRLSPQELRDIYRGKEATDDQLKLIARILRH